MIRARGQILSVLPTNNLKGLQGCLQAYILE